jgi:hypothetical protein
MKDNLQKEKEVIERYSKEIEENKNYTYTVLIDREE